MIRSRLAALLSALWLLALLPTGPAGAQTIVDEWATASPPPAPALKAAAVDPKTTALLVLDILKQNCTPRPRCVATLPHIKSLLDAARAGGALVVYSAFPGAQISDTLPEVAPLGTEPTVIASADKFMGSNLDAILKAKGIKTVVVVGTVANGAVLYTASHAGFLGYDVVVPVDGMSASTTYVEQFTAYQFTVAPTIANHITLTRTSLVTF